MWKNLLYWRKKFPTTHPFSKKVVIFEPPYPRNSNFNFQHNSEDNDFVPWPSPLRDAERLRTPKNARRTVFEIIIRSIFKLKLNLNRLKFTKRMKILISIPFLGTTGRSRVSRYRHRQAHVFLWDFWFLLDIK